MTKILFYKEDDAWYADVAGHTKAENRMVAGADKFLERLDTDKNGIVILRVGAEELDSNYIYSLYRIQHNKQGGTYAIRKNGSRFNIALAWLCNVTHTVLGSHPRKLYIYSIQ